MKSPQRHAMHMSHCPFDPHPCPLPPHTTLNAFWFLLKHKKAVLLYRLTNQSQACVQHILVYGPFWYTAHFDVTCTACREGAAARASLLRRKTAQGIKTAQNNQRRQQSQQQDHHQQQQQQSNALFPSQQQPEPAGKQSGTPLLPPRTRGRPRKMESAAAGSLDSPADTPSLSSSSSSSRSNAEDTSASHAAGAGLDSDTISSTDTSPSGAPPGAAVSASADSVETPVKRRGRPRKALSSIQVVPASGQQPQGKSGVAKSPGELRDVPDEILQQRAADNPRENPTNGEDVAYD